MSFSPTRTHPRDLIGYGANPPDPKWPGGAKLAVSFVLNYEEGGENTIVNGDRGSEVFLNEVNSFHLESRDFIVVTVSLHFSPSRHPVGHLVWALETQVSGDYKEMVQRKGHPSTKHFADMETQYEYGSRAGVWRIANIFEKRGFKFTVYAVGRAVELHPTVITSLHNAGHDIASHNHRWVDYAALPPAEVHTHVRDCVAAIKAATGHNPKGWYSGRIGPDTRREVVRALNDQGLQLEWESDAYNDDLPYWSWDFEDITGEPLLIIPYTLDANDMKYGVPPGFTSPDGFEKYIKDAVDMLLEEGRAAALSRVLDYIQSLGPEVWVATRSEIAEHFKKTPLLLVTLRKDSEVEVLDIVRILIAAGANVNASNAKVYHGAQADAVDGDMRTPLHFGVANAENDSSDAKCAALLVGCEIQHEKNDDCAEQVAKQTSFETVAATVSVHARLDRMTGKGKSRSDDNGTNSAKREEAEGSNLWWAGDAFTVVPEPGLPSELGTIIFPTEHDPHTSQSGLTSSSSSSITFASPTISTKTNLPAQVTNWRGEPDIPFLKSWTISKKKLQDVAPRDVRGETPLHLASSFGKPAAVALLLRYDASLLAI
ncbi:hypothetical protein HDU93_006640 [Gonapodya sp. JEL0774]|nr:hypothetical protein HDU93_006640 [Gonapodya sp. JEL0774]